MTLPSGISPVRRKVLSEDVYEQLKELIVDHRLAPEDRLNIDALARELRVSPTPIREALARLESDGLVRKRPLAGYTVSPLLTRAEFADLFDMRMLLEGAAARWAATRASGAIRATIKSEARIPYATDAGSHAAFTAQDARFHDLIARAAESPRLHDAIDRLHAHLHIHRLYFPYAETGSTGIEHQRIATAISAADPDGAENAMRAHLTAARSRHQSAFD
jgi:DNA-binding GntR family transcriptional regulator